MSFGETKTLNGVWGIDFGYTEEEVIQKLHNSFSVSPNRSYQQDDYQILEYRNWRKKVGDFNKLRVMIHPEEGTFSIEEEIYLIWDLQKSDEENWEIHHKAIIQTMKKLRRQYGQELFYEEPNINRYSDFPDYISAVWSFDNNCWIHLLYEPQDWNVFPGLMKMIIIYRDSNKDKR